MIAVRNMKTLLTKEEKSHFKASLKQRNLKMELNSKMTKIVSIIKNKMRIINLMKLPMQMKMKRIQRTLNKVVIFVTNVFIKIQFYDMKQ